MKRERPKTPGFIRSLVTGVYGPQAGNPAASNKDRGLIDVRGGRSLFSLVKSDVSFVKQGVFLRI